MRNLIRILSLLLIAPLLTAQTGTHGEILKEGTYYSGFLPLIVIDTKGQTIPNEPKIMVTIRIIDNGPGKLNSVNDSGNQYEGPAGIELRGESSQMFPKKSYSLELRNDAGEDVKASLCEMPSESDWILYAPYSDKTMLRNAITFHFGRLMGDWQPDFRFCELYLNGSYEGIYQLTEKIKRDKKRVNIAKMDASDNAGDLITGGYIVKVDKITGLSSDDYFINYPDITFFNARYYAWSYDYPKPEDMTPEQKTYIQKYIKAVENTINGSSFSDPVHGYRSYLDVASFIDFQIMNEIVNNVDGYRYSTFFHKQRDSDGGKFRAGPLWDFDLCYGNLDYSPRNYATDQWNYTNWGPLEANCMPWWYRFMEDPLYAKALRIRWTELRNGSFRTDSFMNYIDSQIRLLGDAVTRNFSTWNILGTYVWPNSAVRYTYSSEISFLKSWISNRLSWMDYQWYYVTTPVDTIPEFENITVYPNPVSDYLNLELPPSYSYYTIELCDVRGSIIFKKTPDKTESVKYRINCTGLREGVYLLRVTRPGGKPYIAKIFKKG
jgi:CotH kinase protein/Secretion system C-terminal sorting domain